MSAAPTGQRWNVECEKSISYALLVVPGPDESAPWLAHGAHLDEPGVGHTPRLAVLHAAYRAGWPVVSTHGPGDPPPAAVLLKRVAELEAAAARWVEEAFRFCQANTDLGLLTTSLLLEAQQLAADLASGPCAPDPERDAAHLAAGGTWVGVDAQGAAAPVVDIERAREFVHEGRFVRWLWLGRDRRLVPPPEGRAGGRP